MEVVVGARASAVGTVKADDVEVLVFDPDAAGEASLAGLGQRSHIEHQGTDFAEKLPANIVKLVVLLVEAVRVHIDHLEETLRQILHSQRQHVAEAAKHPPLASSLIAICQGVETDTLGKNRAAEEILIAGRNGAKIVVSPEILNVRLHQRRKRLERVHLSLFRAE